MFTKKSIYIKISRNLKLQLYNTLIRPTVTYTSETWVLKENINKLMTFERKILLLQLALQPFVGFGLLYDFVQQSSIFTLLSPVSHFHLL